jgi:crotonobetainyl-CoA:carnitine CoA-transferase CaiB-like acyl-CoA transferase
VRYSKNELVEIKEPPLLGEDTEKILKGILGYSDDAIA